MKVLHILYQSLPNTSGSSIRSRDILHSQLKIGLKPIVITSPFQNSFSNNIDFEKIDGISYYRTFSNSKEKVSENKSSLLLQIKKLFRIVTFTIQVYKVAKKEEVDIIHAHAMFFCAIAGKISSLLLQKPIIYEVRSLWEERYKKNSFANFLIFTLITLIETFCMFFANHIVVINKNLKNELQRRFLIKNKEITIIGNAVDLSRVIYSSLERDKIIFAYIGTLSPIEGLDLLITAFNNLKDKIENKLLIFGDGIIIKDLKNMAKGNSSIEFKGKVSSDEIYKAYEQVDVIINPRKKSYLTNTVTPLKTLEAMAYKKLVLASDVGGMKELIDNGKNGMLFKSDSVDQIEKIILNTIKKQDINKTIENAYSFILEHRNWIQNAKNYNSLYEKLING